MTRPPALTWLGHATVAIELGGVRLLTDPVLRDRVVHLRRQVAAPDRRATGDVDAVLLSHLHFDHLDVPSLRRLGSGVRIVAPRGSGPYLRRRGFRDVRELAPGDSLAVGGAAVTAVAAEHDGRRHPRGAFADPVGFVIEGSARIYFAGDTALFDGMAELAGRVDVALLPIWGWGPTLGPGHMDPLAAATALTLIRPAVAVPIHWGTLFPVGLARARARALTEPPRAFVREAARLAPGVRIEVLAPGETLALR
jgi:L-ascorbate metabolism protein UlaG (beta-lactamase superfamily)